MFTTRSKTSKKNRQLLEAELRLPASPLWLNQEHGKHVIESDAWSASISADACISRKNGVVCTVLTADCVPLLLCDDSGQQVAAVHVGWRGLCQDIVTIVLSHFNSHNSKIMAWLGPHIHQHNYEVGDEVRSACLRAIPGTDYAFTINHNGLWQANLGALVRQQLQNHGLSMVYDCNLCTFDEQNKFYSYRRDQNTGRMASLIWMESDNY